MNARLSMDEVIDTLESRGAVYAFLGSAYVAEASTEYLLRLRDEMMHHETELDDSPGHALLLRSLRALDENNLEAVAMELRSDYAGMFLAAGKTHAPPFESYYTNEDHMLMQEARDQVLAEYRAEGISRSKGFKEPEDHVGLEMEFMAYLCRQAAGALRSQDPARAKHYLEKQRDFLNKHLQNWVPQFCRDVRRAAKTDFYKAIAQITEDHLAYEPEAIEELLGGLEKA